jgi:hypothetical protein
MAVDGRAVSLAATRIGCSGGMDATERADAVPFEIRDCARTSTLDRHA